MGLDVPAECGVPRQQAIQLCFGGTACIFSKGKCSCPTMWQVTRTREAHGLLSLGIQARQTPSAVAMDKMEPNYEKCMVASADCPHGGDVRVAACLAKSGKRTAPLKLISLLICNQHDMCGMYRCASEYRRAAIHTH